MKTTRSLILWLTHESPIRFMIAHPISARGGMTSTRSTRHGSVAQHSIPAHMSSAVDPCRRLERTPRLTPEQSICTTIEVCSSHNARNNLCWYAWISMARCGSTELGVKATRRRVRHPPPTISRRSRYFRKTAVRSCTTAQTSALQLTVQLNRAVCRSRSSWPSRGARMRPLREVAVRQTNECRDASP